MANNVGYPNAFTANSMREYPAGLDSIRRGSVVTIEDPDGNVFRTQITCLVRGLSVPFTGIDLYSTTAGVYVSTGIVTQHEADINELSRIPAHILSIDNCVDD